MNTGDIIKVRAALEETAAHLYSQQDSARCRELAKEAVIAFERLIAEPMPAHPQIPLRAQIATAAMQGMLASPEMHEYPDDKLANYAVNAADALIERLSQEKK